ncbi:MAG: pyridoxamine 5'-phosphate oxidase family protein [Sedimentisphaerales bacterium]|nr:pyridoxamine 5'-phosphate oxidase family protein [Sedimentisphaerales bacterium]
MKSIPAIVKEAIAKQDIFPVATADTKSNPNIAYIKYLKLIDDQTVLIADNYLCKTRDNIIKNPQISFVVLDSEKGSFQVKGSAQRLTEGPLFDEVQTWVPEQLPRAAAVVMKVQEVFNGAEQLV